LAAARILAERPRFKAKMPGVVSLRNSSRVPLEVQCAQRNNSCMRSLAGLAGVLVGVALIFVVYHFYLKAVPTTDSGTATTQAISLTGVRTDLLQIADAEHGYIATNGHCVSLPELISSNSISMTRTEREGYSYSIECNGGDFTATARHLPAPAGSPIRYPNLAIDSGMQVREIE
jgi:hypothetical protein